jgi:putative endonuclease
MQAYDTTRTLFGGSGARARRQGHEAFGRVAELVAALVLMLKGYRILARRFRTRSGEIDLVAVRGGRLAFVEVKARASDIDAGDVLGRRQAGRIAAAAAAFVARRPRYRDHTVGLDAVLVSLDRLPRHLPDALQPC